MRVLVHPHVMEMGGSQYNAIELADAVRRDGHEVLVYGPPGVLVGEAHRRRLEVILAPTTRRTTPSPSSAGRLTQLVREREVDLVHSYEWNATLDALYGPGWLLGVPVVSTVLSMAVPSIVPSSVPLVVGTRELLERESSHRADVTLIEPPVDTERNRPGAAPAFEDTGLSVRRRWGIGADEFLIVLVGRLSPGLKIGGVLEAIRALGLLPGHLRAHLLIVGDGPERATVERAAAPVNAASPRRRVTVTGLVMDPRPVYDAADLVLGMGSSILRGLAFGKAAIVQGERGFWEQVDASSIPMFLQQGWCGLGNGDDGAPRLAHLVESLAADPDRRASNGALGRHLVVDCFSLTGAAAQLSALYRRVQSRRLSPADRLQTAAHTTYWVARGSTAGAVRRVDDRFRPQQRRRHVVAGLSDS
jgi:glycosyltransferase involved in cell wall biosynthesis